MVITSNALIPDCFHNSTRNTIPSRATCTTASTASTASKETQQFQCIPVKPKNKAHLDTSKTHPLHFTPGAATNSPRVIYDIHVAAHAGKTGTILHRYQLSSCELLHVVLVIAAVKAVNLRIILLKRWTPKSSECTTELYLRPRCTVHGAVR